MVCLVASKLLLVFLPAGHFDLVDCYPKRLLWMNVGAEMHLVSTLLANTRKALAQGSTAYFRGRFLCNAQVLKKRLAMNEPTIMAGGFLYEEGEGLEDDEAAANAALLPRPLADLPGGGLGHGALAVLRDQSQDVSLQLVIEHQARPCGGSKPRGPCVFQNQHCWGHEGAEH